MDRKKRWTDRLADSGDLRGEPMPMQPLVEIAGDRRVLIEHHHGVVQYSTEKICVKVRYGTVSICGRELELNLMNKCQLVVAGHIDCVQLDRRER